MTIKNRGESEPRALTPQEVSEQYAVSTGTLANWRYRLEGPKFHRVRTRMILYFREDLERFFKQNPVLTKDSLPE